MEKKKKKIGSKGGYTGCREKAAAGGGENPAEIVENSVESVKNSPKNGFSFSSVPVEIFSEVLFRKIGFSKLPVKPSAEGEYMFVFSSGGERKNLRIVERIVPPERYAL